MKKRGHSRPLLWTYNPFLAGPFAMLPAALRVAHATENYFDFDASRLAPRFLDFHRAVLSISDRVIAVSAGVGAGIERAVPGAKVVVSTNACDYDEYASGQAAVVGPRADGEFEKVAVYAGNINSRLDFALIDACVGQYPRTRFAFWGPVALRGSDGEAWGQVLRHPNAKAFGPVAPERLPGIYREADLGLIPYKQEPWLVRNGFPLKALEMTAAGLPVVSSWMEPLREIERVIKLAHSSEEFRALVGSTSRGRLSGEDRLLMDEECRKRSYDNQFRAILDALSAVPEDAPSRREEAYFALFEVRDVEREIRAHRDGGPVRVARQVRRFIRRSWRRVPESWRWRVHRLLHGDAR